MPSSIDRKRDDLRRFRLVLGGSILIYLALAALTARCLPDSSVVPWVFLVFGAHSAFLLLTGRRSPDS